ncbi:MAG: BON domain-containing protein [Planctomycetaceae bacterium]|nr:BON domain-containing protein [Planctomycetaceae bacterium]
MQRGSRSTRDDSQAGASPRRDYEQRRDSEFRDYDDSQYGSREFPDRHQQGQPRGSQGDGRWPRYADDFGLQTGPDSQRMGQGKRGVTSDWNRNESNWNEGPEQPRYRDQGSRQYGDRQYGEGPYSGGYSRSGTMGRSDVTYGQGQGSYGQRRETYGQSSDDMRYEARSSQGGGLTHRAYSIDPGHASTPRHFSQEPAYSYPGMSSASGEGRVRANGPYSGKGPKGYKRSDDQICEEANQRLERNGDVDASEIEVSCNGGTLILRGKVEDRRAKREAEDCVEDIYGVQDVMNELKVDRGFFAKLFNTDNKDDAGAGKGQHKKSSN